MQWKLNVNFSILNQEGAEIELTNVDILWIHCVHGTILAGKNLTYMSFTDSIHELDNFMVNRATNDSINIGAMATADAAADMPQGNMPTIAAAIACVSLSLVVVLLSTANGNGKEIKVCPTVAADTASNTADTTTAMSKRKKVIDASSSSSAAASKKSRTTKGKKPPINLCQFLTYAVINNCMKQNVHAIAHSRKGVTGNAKMITGSIAHESSSNHQWHQRCPLGKKVFPDNSKFENMTPLEAFLMMMLPDELNLILELSNKILKLSRK